MTEELNGGCLDEREAFEAWAKQRGNRLDKFGSALGIWAYEDDETQAAFVAWQARASLSTSKQAGAEPVAWAIPRSRQFSWEPQDARYWTALVPTAAPGAAIAAREQSPDDELLVACITLNGATLTVEPHQMAEMFGTDDEQHAYELTFKRLTRAAYEALGEFNGF
jgi:hypothetical protein